MDFINTAPVMYCSSRHCRTGVSSKMTKEVGGSRGLLHIVQEESRKQAEAGSGCGDEEEKQEVDLGSGVCKWFNVRLGFGFLTMSSRDGVPQQDVFVHQSKLHMEGFRSLREGEAVEFTFNKSSRGLESLRVTGPNGAPCLGSERRPKRSRGSRGERCYNCGAPGHHAKQCQLPPQPKKCHICQSLNHMVSSCPIRAQQHQSAASSHRGEEQEHHPL